LQVSRWRIKSSISIQFETNNPLFLGNHDISFDARKAIQQEYSNFADTKGFSVDDMKKFLTNCIYLEDSWIEVLGYKIYGSPWTPINKDDSFR